MQQPEPLQLLLVLVTSGILGSTHRPLRSPLFLCLRGWTGVALTQGLQGMSIFRQSIKVIWRADSCVFVSVPLFWQQNINYKLHLSIS